MLLAHDRCDVLRFKADNQCDFLLHPAHFVPRNPHTVGMSDLRFAVMGRKLLRCDDVFSVGLGAIRIASDFVESVNDQDTLDLDGSLLLALVEHQPSPESTNGRRVGPGKHRVGPHGDHPVGLSGLVVAVERPRSPRLRAFDCRRKPSQDQETTEGFLDVRESKTASFHRCFQHETSLRDTKTV